MNSSEQQWTFVVSVVSLMYRINRYRCGGEEEVELVVRPFNCKKEICFDQVRMCSDFINHKGSLKSC